MSSEQQTTTFLLQRQAAVCSVFCLLLAIIVGGLYWQDRQREWTLRCEQAKHRLDVAFELISREVDRVRSDALFLADQLAVRKFAQGDQGRLAELQREYTHFLNRKEMYDQLRLLDLNGRETIRVNYAPDRATRVNTSALQDKSDRYYFQESLTLDSDDVFVSEFDLNVEHGQIEQPFKPVIRFVTPVVDEKDQTAAFLVLNYLGGRLLHDLDDESTPGFTLLLRSDGHYIKSRHGEDSWGWLLGHQATFASQYPREWETLGDMRECQLTDNGAFAARRISLGRRIRSVDAVDSLERPTATSSRDSIVAVAFLPRDRVFSAANEMLRRLLLVAVCVFIPVAIIARHWAYATLTKRIQAGKIAASEEKLRELSSRLLRIQEDERRAISREIHDDFGQQVTAINLDLKLAQRSMEASAARSHLERAVGGNETLLKSLHAFATRVRPAVLDDLGVHDAVESHLDEFQQRSGICVTASLEFDAHALPDEIVDNAYRLLQESLNNVLKHANATRVWVAMTIEPDDPPHFLLSVRDNGQGYEANGIGGGLGLIGMRERVELLGGKIHLQSDADSGTVIEIELPLRAQHGESEIP